MKVLGVYIFSPEYNKPTVLELNTSVKVNIAWEI